MRAIILQSFGGPEQLVYDDIPKPALKSDEVLIRVRAIGVNPVDVKTRIGKGQAARLKEDPPMILGWDVSGAVVEKGSDVTKFKVGDEVFGMINLPGRGKCYAEFVAAPAAHLAHKAHTVSHEEAAAAGIAAVTAWQALNDQAHVQRGQTVLIHAASGGVGHYAVQIAKHLGAYVVGTSSAANRDFVLSLGTDEHIDYKAQLFEDVAPKADAILDAIGGAHIDRSLKVLKEGGTIVSLPSGNSQDVGEKAAKQNKKGIFFLVHSDGNDMQQLASMLSDGRLRSHLAKVFSFDEVRKAHEMIENGKTAGKIVMAGPEEIL
jgi:NADPH:quinone reductase-like Zn-dependent oxidoreductase